MPNSRRRTSGVWCVGRTVVVALVVSLLPDVLRFAEWVALAGLCNPPPSSTPHSCQCFNRHHSLQAHVETASLYRDSVARAVVQSSRWASVRQLRRSRTFPKPCQSLSPASQRFPAHIYLKMASASELTCEPCVASGSRVYILGRLLLRLLLYSIKILS